MVSQPSIRHQLKVPEAENFRASLRAEDQAIFDQLYAASAESYIMMTQVGLVIPLEKLLFAMVIELQKEIDRLENALSTIPGSTE